MGRSWSRALATAARPDAGRSKGGQEPSRWPLRGCAAGGSRGPRLEASPSRRSRATPSARSALARKAINRLCRKADHPPLSQGGDGLVDHVARIVALQKVDPLRGARSVRHDNPNIAAVEGWRRFATKNSACEQRRFLRGTWAHHNHRWTSCKPGHAAKKARAGAALCLSCTAFEPVRMNQNKSVSPVDVTNFRVDRPHLLGGLHADVQRDCNVPAAGRGANRIVEV